MANRLIRAVLAEWNRNHSRALRAAEAAMDMSREDLAELLEERPRLVPLYVQILWAAGMNGHDETLRAMAAAFASGARGNDDAIEDAELVLRALAAFTPRHFHVLRALSEANVRFNNDRPNYAEFLPRVIADRAGVSRDVARQCLINFAGAGLASMQSVLAGEEEDADTNVFPITQLGRDVVAAVAASAAPR